ncbi:isopenicillin N synthase family dioxygenase [Novosphingobium aquimarinum]|uniref:isopenicillin N synthase family dioxygenase n=1 Tax=Novosphingobium aquimarinum TaxID=2682494 RepID=UPI0012EBE945|nr:2OG-Fe(II) oxygenase family protein [Novosphingobium aquimarinum]
MTIPLIDLRSAPDAGQAMDAGLADYGFLQLAHIGISPAELAAVFQASETFFKSSPDSKRRCAYRSAAENFGYQGLLEENLDPAAPADVKETFTMRNIAAAPPPQERWPSDAFREIMCGFYARALACAHQIQRQMATRLGMPPDYFTRLHSGQNVTLRLLYYPASQSGAEARDPAQLGAGAHTDYGFMTLLFQHGVGGLQVMDSADAWIDVPPRDEAVVVNSGDMLERWTNGRYKSTMHRVIAMDGQRDRLSIAMFIDPDSDALIEALPSCVSPENPARFGPISAGAHLQARLAASHKGRFAQ